MKSSKYYMSHLERESKRENERERERMRERVRERKIERMIDLRDCRELIFHNFCSICEVKRVCCN